MKLPLVLLRDHHRINQKGSDNHAHQPINKTRITINLQMKSLVSVDRFAMLTRQATDGLLLLQAIGLLGFSWVFRRGSAELGLWARVTAQGMGHGLRVILRAYVWSRVLGVGTGLGTGLGLRDSGYGPQGTEPGSGLGSGLGTGLDYRTWVMGWYRAGATGLSCGPGFGAGYRYGTHARVMGYGLQGMGSRVGGCRAGYMGQITGAPGAELI